MFRFCTVIICCVVVCVNHFLIDRLCCWCYCCCCVLCVLIVVVVVVVVKLHYFLQYFMHVLGFWFFWFLRVFCILWLRVGEVFYCCCFCCCGFIVVVDLLLYTSAIVWFLSPRYACKYQMLKIQLGHQADWLWGNIRRARARNELSLLDFSFGRGSQPSKQPTARGQHLGGMATQRGRRGCCWCCW